MVLQLVVLAYILYVRTYIVDVVMNNLMTYLQYILLEYNCVVKLDLCTRCDNYRNTI